jgi:glycosyltransferase involved in cell wall biosynthesis
MNPPEPRILMTTDAVGGVWTYATTLSRALCERGYEVTLVTLGPSPSSEQLAGIDGVPGLQVEPTDLALEWMDPEGEDFHRACELLPRIAARVQPDVVHINGYREALIGFDAPIVVVAHSCVGSWWDACRAPAPIEAKWAPYLRRVRAALETADAWIAPSDAYRGCIERLYAVARKGDVIWNGAPRIQPGTHKQDVILSAGRVWDEAKNLSALARIAPMLPWPVRIAGSSEYEPGAAVSDGLAHLGQLPHAQLLDQMRKAAVFVSPALYEPFGLGVLEAAACGCALVLADIPSFRELWSDAALFADPHTDQEFAEAIRAVCGDETLRTDLQRKAIKRARRYSLDAMVNDYCCLYDRLTLSLQPRVTPAPLFPEVRG